MKMENFIVPFAVIQFLVVIWAEFLYRGETPTDSRDRAVWKKDKKDSLIEAAIVAFLAGWVMYFCIARDKEVFLMVISAVVMAGIPYYLVRLRKRLDVSLFGLLVFAVDFLLMLFLARGATSGLADCLGLKPNGWVQWIPSIGYFVALAFLARETIGDFVFANTLQNDGFMSDFREAWQITDRRIDRGALVGTIIVLALMLLAANFNWPIQERNSLDEGNPGSAEPSSFVGDFGDRIAAALESLKERTQKIESTEPEKEATEASEPVVEDTRDPRFIQEAIGHENWRLCDDFSVRLGERAKEDKRTEVVPQDTTDEVLSLCGHSAELLKFYASSEAFKLCSAELDIKELLTSDGTYLSDEGIALYYRLEGAFKMCKQERAFAPASGTNTGWDSGVVVAENPGISGETKSTRYTTPSGYAFDVMDRCANVVFHNPPKDYPKGRTDEKDPSKAPKTNTEPGDGPDPNTNTGVGSKVSAADQPNNSGSKTYEEYVKDNSELQKTNEEQQQGGSPNTPSTRPSGDVTVDNNGDGDSGHAPIDEPTPTAPLAKTEDGEPIATDPGVPWGGPPD